ncbi:MAG: hypothetical protein WBL31_01280, partial [Ilumatobacteraceae bacterium]
MLLTGPPGGGKSTVGRLVAEAFERSVHIEADVVPAEGSRRWNAIIDGAARCAVANASLTYRSKSGARLRTRYVSA